MHDLFKEQLDNWKNKGLWRERRVISTPQKPHLLVDNKPLVSFASNDYLGFASHPKVVEAMQEALSLYGAGAGSSAMVSGHHVLFHELENRFAQLQHHKKAIHFSTGYMANMGVLNAITLNNTAIFSDALNHASLIDGIRLSKAEEICIYPHLDINYLEQALSQSTKTNKWIVTDGVFSMDGDIAPLRQLLELAERYDAYIYLDDAHGFGVLGSTGRGILEHFAINSCRIVYMATLGKAMGVFGALVSGDEMLIDWILQKSRSYIFTTGSPPVLAAGVLAAISLLQTDLSYHTRLKELIAYLSQHLHSMQSDSVLSETAIHPIILGDNQRVMYCMSKLLEENIWVPAIRPPTVPVGSARLRISLCANHELSDIDRLMDVLSKVL
ncbi:MAG: 8-amino-7-oxononanoate synthase [Betaproteobacteria bacterium]|nr:8-amino-7-oxononanoate synthase [Betaproteobacteria bacterium]